MISWSSSEDPENSQFDEGLGDELQEEAAEASKGAATMIPSKGKSLMRGNPL